MDDSRQQPPVEQFYDAADQRLTIWRFITEIPGYPQLAWRNRGLIRNFFIRDLQGRFRGSMLGTLWVLIHPLFLFLTYYLVFGIMFGQRGKESQGSMWYSIYLFSGILAWSAFTDTTIRATGVVVGNGNLIKKVAFPAQILPLHLGVVNLLVYGVGLLVLAVVMIVTSMSGSYLGDFPGFRLLFLPVALFNLFLFSIGLGLLLSAIQVFARDTAQIFPIIANLWFFASPVFWYKEMFDRVQEDGSITNTMAPFAIFFYWNPLTPILELNREVLGIVTRGDQLRTWQELVMLSLRGLVPSALFFVVGYCIFRSLQNRFADEV
mgnify:CR=1 FL=1